jgi:hypothetical protein
MPPQDQLYVFIDNSFLFLQGYKHVQQVAKLGGVKHTYVDYLALRNFLLKQGELKRSVIIGSDLPGGMISKCQAAGFEVFTFPKYPEFKSGKPKEKGIDHKICWEIAKTIFTNKDPVPNKKIILCTGDKDFMTVLSDIHTSNWAFELWLWTNSYSPKFAQQVKVFGTVKELDGEWKHFIKIGDKAAAEAAH